MHLHENEEIAFVPPNLKNGENFENVICLCPEGSK